MTRFTHDVMTMQRPERCRTAWAHCTRTGLSLASVISFAKGDPD